MDTMNARPIRTSAAAALPAIGDPVEIVRPTMFRPHRVADDVDVLPAYLPVPGLGVLAANAFVIHGDEPVLVDSGPGGLADGSFELALRSVIDPADLRWMWLTHTDPDHIGSLGRVLEVAPQVRVVTTFLGLGKLGMVQPVPMERCWFANPGDSVHVGDRKLLALRPPTFDAPETTACFDPRSGVLFSADAFGAVLSTPATSAESVDDEEHTAGSLLWGTVDAPWVHAVEPTTYRRWLEDIAHLEPRLVASSHLPVTSRLARLLDLASALPDTRPWVGPDQAALEAALAAMASQSVSNLD